MNKKIKIFIICSVMLNVLFAGLIGGQALKHMGLNFSQNKPIVEILKKTKIPENRRVFIESQLSNIFENNRSSSRSEIEKMRDETFKILTAEIFDETAYKTQIDKMFDMRGQQRKDTTEAIKNLANQLNLEERLALAEILRNMPRKH